MVSCSWLAPFLFLAPMALPTGCGTRPPKAPTTTTPVASAPPAPSIALAAPVPTTMSTRATLKLVPTWRACHESFVVSGSDPRADVERLAASCADVTKMHRVGEPFTGDQAAAGKPQTFKWRAQGGHCYRAYGAGAKGIKNLDVLLLDSSGASLGQDGTDDGAPVVLDGGAVCWKGDDDATLVVSVGDGGGPFAVEVWGD